MGKYIVISGTEIYRNPVIEAVRRATETGCPHPSDVTTFALQVKATMEASERRYRKTQNGNGSR